MATEPPATPWVFPSLEDAEPEGPVAIGGDLEPGTLLSAYRSGLFPMPVGRRGRLGWWSPDPRAVLPVEGFHHSRSLRRSMRHFELRVDTAFESVVRACGDPRRPHGWITPEIVEAYVRLYDLGWAHSIETWHDDRLVGGLYGVGIGAFFAGESMFHHETDASKAAVAGLAALMAGTPHALVDVQWSTPHLASLGVIEIERSEYLERLAVAVRAPGPEALGR
ncbi:MAG: leucyl/phenylalanyl-tRNA--protein transferase [Microthrixaceae bacterium]